MTNMRGTHETGCICLQCLRARADKNHPDCKGRGYKLSRNGQRVMVCSCTNVKSSGARNEGSK